MLDAQSINALPLNSLVRFRCMVQDTELSQEVALFASTVSNKHDGEKVCGFNSDNIQLIYAFALRAHVKTDFIYMYLLCIIGLRLP